MPAQWEYLGSVVQWTSQKINLSYPVLWMVEDVYSSFSRFSLKLAINHLTFVCTCMPSTEEECVLALNALAEKCNSRGKFTDLFHHFIKIYTCFSRCLCGTPWKYPQDLFLSLWRNEEPWIISRIFIPWFCWSCANQK